MDESRRRIFCISMVKNEADIIESFVRYHQNIFDGMVILDNQSSDNTLTILFNLMSEGVPVYVTKDTNNEYTPDEKYTALLYQTFEKYHPDIIIPLDADEFLISSNNHGNPRDILEHIDENKTLHIKWKTYIPMSTDNLKELFIPNRIHYARKDCYEYNKYAKVIVSKTIVSKYSPTLEVGNHALRFNNHELVQSELLDDLRLAHFPIRSIEQIMSKIFVGWVNSLSRHNIAPGQSWQREKLFNMLKEKQNITFKDLTQMTKEFCVDETENDIQIVDIPMDLSFCKSDSLNIMYTKYNEINPMKNLLENCVSLAKQYSKLKREIAASTPVTPKIAPSTTFTPQIRKATLGHYRIFNN